MASNSSLSERLISHINEVAALMAPYLMGDSAVAFLAEASPLLTVLDASTLVKLAFTSDYLHMIALTFDESIDQSYPVVADFVESALAYFQEHLDGYDIGDDGVPLTGLTFLLKLGTSTDPFGFECEPTYALAWLLAGRIDACLDQPAIMESYLSMRSVILHAIIHADGTVSSHERLAVEDEGQCIRDLLDFAGKSRQALRQYCGGNVRKAFSRPPDPVLLVWCQSRNDIKATRSRPVEHVAARMLPRSNTPQPAVQAEVLIGQQGQRAASALQMLEDARRELAEMVGLPRVKEEVRRFDAFLQIQRQRVAAGLPTSKQALHFVFYGNPGTGKTTVARILGKFLCGYEILTRGHVVETDRAGLCAEYMGQTAVKTDAKVREALDGILFIDEAYTLAPENMGQHDYGREAIDILLKRMEDYRDRLVIIAAGYPDPMARFIASNPGLQSRFTRFMNFDDYTPEDMGRICSLFLAKQHYRLTTEARANLSILFAVAFAARDERFGNGRFVRNVFEEMVNRQAMRLTADGGPLDKESLQVIAGTDVPLDMARVDPGTVKLDAARWRVDCPSCKAQSRVPMDMLGKKVKCQGCGHIFVIEWPMLENSGGGRSQSA